MYLPVQSAGVLRGGSGYPVVAHAGSVRAGAGVHASQMVSCNCNYTCKTGDAGTASGQGMDPTSCNQNCCMNAQMTCRNIPNSLTACNAA